MIANTPRSATFFGSSSTARIDTPLITRRLKAADPTIVDGPRTGGTASISYNVYSTERRISGADEPRAISVKFATVAFQRGTSIEYYYLASLEYN